jgi:hypothetical protein
MVLSRQAEFSQAEPACGRQAVSEAVERSLKFRDEAWTGIITYLQLVYPFLLTADKLTTPCLPKAWLNVTLAPLKVT